jgi:hypothetical protein
LFERLIFSREIFANKKRAYMKKDNDAKNTTSGVSKTEIEPGSKTQMTTAEKAKLKKSDLFII